MSKSLAIKNGKELKPKEQEFIFSDAVSFDSIVLSEDKVTEIVSVVDSSGNKFYEVPFLAQDTVFDSVENTSLNDPSLSTYQNDTPYLLKLIKTARRFTTYVRDDNKMEIRFGSGISSDPDEEIIPNPDEVGSSLPGSPTYLNTTFDPSNFLATKAYGQAPSNTELTITYRYGGGINNNVRANSIRSIQSANIDLDETGLSAALATTTKASIAINNPTPAPIAILRFIGMLLSIHCLRGVTLIITNKIPARKTAPKAISQE